VPHPLLAQRAFVLVPLAEVAPEAVHPEARETVAELLARLSPDERAQVRPYRPIHRTLPEPEAEDGPARE